MKIRPFTHTPRSRPFCSFGIFTEFKTLLPIFTFYRIVTKAHRGANRTTWQKINCAMKLFLSPLNFFKAGLQKPIKFIGLNKFH